MIVPCSMKMRMIAPREAPIDTRIAMSLCFSITISTSVATMFSAATATIRPIVIPIAIFSIHSAENRLWFIWTQSVVMYPSPSWSRMALATRLTANMSSSRTSTSVVRSASSNSRCASASGR